MKALSNIKRSLGPLSYLLPLFLIIGASLQILTACGSKKNSSSDTGVIANSLCNINQIYSCAHNQCMDARNAFITCQAGQIIQPGTTSQCVNVDTNCLGGSGLIKASRFEQRFIVANAGGYRSALKNLGVCSYTDTSHSWYQNYNQNCAHWDAYGYLIMDLDSNFAATQFVKITLIPSLEGSANYFNNTGQGGATYQLVVQGNLIDLGNHKYEVTHGNYVFKINGALNSTIVTVDVHYNGTRIGYANLRRTIDQSQGAVQQPYTPTQGQPYQPNPIVNPGQNYHYWGL